MKIKTYRVHLHILEDGEEQCIAEYEVKTNLVGLRMIDFVENLLKKECDDHE